MKSAQSMAIVATALLVMLLASGCGGGGGGNNALNSGSQGASTAPADSLASAGSMNGTLPVAQVTAVASPGADWVATPPIIVVDPNSRATITTYNPSHIRTAYGIDAYSTSTGNAGQGQTIAVVDAYGSPTVQNDFNVFCSQYGLPQQSLSIAYPSGKPSRTNSGWALETSLDVQWAHAVAPGATIIVVVARSASYSDLVTAIDYAVALKAGVVSMSWGGREFSTETTTSTESHFVKNGVSFVAASGDGGAGTMWPAVSPNVLAVGGTTLALDASSAIASETGWSGSGGGRSAYEVEPLYQVNSSTAHPVAQGKRAMPDVAYDADPGTGFAVYTSTAYNGQKGWFTVGGTSAGSPQWAGIIALANAQRASLARPRLGGSVNTALYGTTGDLRDITVGSNGAYSALPGFDLVTGLGSPTGSNLIPALVAY